MSDDHAHSHRSPRVLGVDATRKGWVGIVLDTDGAFVDALVKPDIASLVEAAGRLSVVAIDIPIGLPDAGARQADSEARKMLGGRHSSVFSSPTRGAMEADGYATAAAAQRAATGRV